LLPQAAPAQVPDSGRWQELRFGAEEVGERMEDRYIEQVVELAAAGRLDADRALLHRLRYISRELIAAAIELKPEAASWPWEVHLASGPDIEAVCLAGGKLLVGADFVRRLALDDSELAVLLAHEVAHAIAEHSREFLSEAQLVYRPLVPVDVVMLRLDSDLSLQLRLASLARTQEREADQLGMVLAHRAGWPTSAMLSFYRKLADADGGAGESLVASHPSHASRISMSRGMARLLEP
jgi:predicted Zn-dependent protease